MKLLRIACYWLQSRATIFSITKLSFNSENIVIYDRQYPTMKFTAIIESFCRDSCLSVSHDIIKDNFETLYQRLM